MQGQSGKVQKVIFFLVILFVMAFVAMQVARSVSSTQNASPDLLLDVKSANGQFMLSASPDTEPIPMNKIHTWKVQITDAAGIPLENASFEVDGGMPSHGHGLPTRPRMTRTIGSGEYLVEGFRFQMPGEWVVNFHITAGSIDDTATVRFTLR